MQTKPLDHAPSHPERRQAVWPWLLMPLVTLALFFALQNARERTWAKPHGAAATAQPVEAPSPR
jgi:hypothetical protein